MRNEMDKEIAEKVFGWTDVELTVGGNVLYGCPDDDYNRDYPTNKYAMRVPDYSDDIAAAFSVVERMRELKCCFSLVFNCEIGWYAMFYTCEKTEGTYMVPTKGETTPAVAICKAALLSIKDNQEG